MSIIFSSVMTPIYGSIVDATGSFFAPTMLSIGIATATFVVILIYTKETYGSVVKD